MFVLPLVILFGLAAGIGYFRLQQGPVSVNFLVDPIRQGIDQGLPGLSATFADVILTLADTGGLELRLRDLQLRENDGETVVSAPQAAIGLSAGALWGLNAAPERVELIEPRISLTYSRDAGLSLDLASGQAEPSDGEGEPVRHGSRPAVPSAVQFTDIITLASDYAREAGGASSLREVGLRNATVVLEAEGKTSYWQVPRLLVDVERRADRSIVSGAARVSSAGRIWTASLRFEDPKDGDVVLLSTAVRDVVPSQIAAAVPGADFLSVFDAPTSADINAQFDRAGQLTASQIAIEATGTQLRPRGMDGPLFTVDAGILNLIYDPKARHLELKPSNVRSGEASLLLSGAAKAIGDQAQAESDWGFEVRAAPAVLGDAASTAVALRSGHARGRFFAAQRRMSIEEMQFDLAGGSIKLSGEIDTGPAQGGARLEGSFSGMPVNQLAALWPRQLAPAGRGWVQHNVLGGEVSTGTITYLSGRHRPASLNGGGGDARLVIAMEAQDVVFTALSGFPEMRAPRALARFEDQTLEVTVPEASMPIDAAQIEFRKGQFVGSDMLGPAPSGQMTFSFEGSAEAISEAFERPVLASAMADNPLQRGVRGNVAGEAVIGFPMDRVITAQDIGYDIRATLSDGQISGVIEGEDIKGASLDIHAAPQSTEVKGEVLIKGVLAKVEWQRLKGGDQVGQPPARLTAKLDGADRKQLGIDLSGILVGDVPVEMTIENPGESGQSVHVRADLTPAELSLGMIGWKKAAGRKAFLDFDVADAGEGGGKTLSNVRITGSDIAVEGEVELNDKWEATQFKFPNFSLDLVSRLRLSGKRTGDGVWKIALDGKTYEGRAFFRNLFSVGDAPPSPDSDPRKGVDVTAKIDNVIGFDDVSLRSSALTMSMRGGRLTALEGRGDLSGGQPMAFELNRTGGRRLIRVDTADAGQAFKLVGFYPNMVGGRLRLEVDLDGSGAAEKTGTLWVDRFRVLGDPVISEVVGTADESVPAIARKQRQMVRQAFDFDSLRAPFSVGHGQIAIQDASMNGALLGATLRGTADYKQKTVDLGGTYVFLQGLNNVFAAIPLLGELLSGPRKEGVFGTNYAIRGSMDRPQVFVHPLSTIAPGIFREIFQLAPHSQNVSPRRDGSGSSGPRARSSSSPATVGTPVSPGRTIEGWNSTTQPN